jgi:serine protease inhibitor
VDGTYHIDTYDVNTVNEWVEITKDTIIEDVVPNGLKTTFKKESLRSLIKKILKEEFKKPLN